MAKLHKAGRFIGGRQIASNSLSVLDGDFISINATGFLVKTDASLTIEGMVAGEQIFASDNETAASKNVEYIRRDEYMEFEIVADAAVVQANVGDTFALNAGTQTIDVATVNVGTQVEMIKFVDQNTSIYRLIRA